MIKFLRVNHLAGKSIGFEHLADLFHPLNDVVANGYSRRSAVLCPQGSQGFLVFIRKVLRSHTSTHHAQGRTETQPQPIHNRRENWCFGNSIEL